MRSSLALFVMVLGAVATAGCGSPPVEAQPPAEGSSAVIAEGTFLAPADGARTRINSAPIDVSQYRQLSVFVAPGSAEAQGVNCSLSVYEQVGDNFFQRGNVNSGIAYPPGAGADAGRSTGQHTEEDSEPLTYVPGPLFLERPGAGLDITGSGSVAGLTCNYKVVGRR